MGKNYIKKESNKDNLIAPSRTDMNLGCSEGVVLK